MEPSERFEWKGRTIAWGKVGRGPAVVLCHGTPFSSRLWHPFAQTLSRDFTVYVWDMPGYGRSSKLPQHAVDFGAQADAFTALLDHWELTRPHVIAHDFGGAVSLRTLLVKKVAYTSLMLVDVVAIPPSGSPFFQFVHDHPDLLEQLPPYVHEAIVRAYVEAASHRGLRQGDLDALVQPWTDEEGQPAFYRQIAHYDERFLVDNEQRLGDIDIPVRIVWGTDDAWIPTEQAHKLAGLIPTASLRLIDSGVGHLVHYDAPVALADEIRSWLDQVAS